MKKSILSLLALCVALTMSAATPNASVSITITGATSGSDVLRIIEYSTFTPGFDNGYDVEQPEANVPGIYALSAAKYLTDCFSNDIEGLEIGFVTGADATYTLSFANLRGSYKLYDTQLMVLHDMTSPYVFSAPKNTRINNRFYLTKLTPEYYTRDNLNIGDYGTLCIPKAVSPEAAAVAGATFYQVAGQANGYLYFDEVTTGLEAGRPYMFQATATTLNCQLNGDPVSTPVVDAANDGLYGSFILRPQGSLDGYYIVLADRIKLCTDEFGGIRENRCYIDLSEVSAAGAPAPGRRRISMAIDQTTGLENTELNTLVQKVLVDGQIYIIRDGVIYNLNGAVVK